MADATQSTLLDTFGKGQRKTICLRLGGSGKLDRVVTVPMPRSLPELQHMAAQNFGHSGCLRLYHQGTTLLYHPAQLNQIQDGDIIIVRKSDCHRPPTAPGTPRALSTHQADFHKHPVERPATTAGKDYESALTERSKGASLDGMSRYATDYVRHPIQPVIPYKPPSALELHNEPLGTTTYAREFPWRETSKRRALVDDRDLRASSLSKASQQERFKGNSSYSIDYPRRDYVEPGKLAMAPKALYESSVKPPPTPFVDATTYSSDFQKLGPGRQRSAKPKGDAMRMNEPFVGTSEYRREYDEKSATDRSLAIQLAMEAFEGQTAQELQKAAEEALRDGGLEELEVPATSEVKSAVTA